MPRLVTAFLVVLGFIVAACDPGSASSANLPPCDWARVVSIVDGDTIRVSIGGREERVRYIGIDTPETASSPSGAEPFGRDATEFNRRLLASGRVCLEKDRTDRDRFGRLLRYPWIADGRLVSEELLRAGLARITTYPPDTRYLESRYAPAEREARAAGRGIWSQ
jgi:micrococcal nuclease